MHHRQNPGSPKGDPLPLRSPMSWQRAFPSLVLLYAALLPPPTGCGSASLPAALVRQPHQASHLVGALLRRCDRGEAVGSSSSSGWLTEGPRGGDAPGGGGALNTSPPRNRCTFRGGKGRLFADGVCRLRGGARPGCVGGVGLNETGTGSSIVEDFFSRPPAPGSSSALFSSLFGLTDYSQVHVLEPPGEILQIWSAKSPGGSNWRAQIGWDRSPGTAQKSPGPSSALL